MRAFSRIGRGTLSISATKACEAMRSYLSNPDMPFAARNRVAQERAAVGLVSGPNGRGARIKVLEGEVLPHLDELFDVVSAR
jgi:hypothetical protein